MEQISINKAQPAAADEAVYHLHYFPFSLYSLMVRFAVVLGQSINSDSAPNVQIKLVNLQKGDNLTEEYLTQVNARGQVPSLTSTELLAPLAESVDISTWLCERQPELLPDEHGGVIKELLNKFYSYHCKALSIPKNGIPNQAAALLEKANLTQAHRRALEIKSSFHNTLHNRTIEPENIRLVETNTKELMDELTSLLESRSRAQDSTWIFGATPTILDAYATVFAARLADLSREDILNDTLRQYVTRVKATPEWNEVTHGRPTLWHESLGPVEEFVDL